MKRLKKYLCSKEFIIATLLMLTVILMNIFSLNKDSFFIGFNDCYAFWFYNMFLGYGEYLQVLIIIIFGFVGIKDFFGIMTSSTFKNSLVRTDYPRFMMKNIIFSYIKAVMPLYLVSTTIFLYGISKYSTILETSNFSYNILIINGIIKNPIIYIAMIYLNWFLFASFVINIMLIFLYYIKKIYVSLTAGFLFTIFLSIIVQNITTILGGIVGGDALKYNLAQYSILQGYYPTSNVLICFFIALSSFIVSALCVWFIYRNKERTVLNFEV